MSDILPNSRAYRWAAGAQGPRLELKVALQAMVDHVRLRTTVTVTSGYSLVSLDVRTKDFRALIDKMIEVDQEEALAALSSALADALALGEFE